MIESQDASQEPLAPPEFASPKEALEFVATVGIDEAAPRLIRHFREPGKEVEFALFFGTMDIAKQAHLFELLLNSVFEDSDFSHDKSILGYRKRMAEQLSMRKGETGSLNSAVTSVLAHSSDGAILFLKENPQKTKRFIGQLTQQNPDDANRIASDLLLRLIRQLPHPAAETP